MPKPPAPPPEPDSLSFEEAVGELEAIVEAMESGSLPLEESLTAYKRGVEVLRAAQARLAAAEQQVKVLEEGMLKPFDAEGGAT